MLQNFPDTRPMQATLGFGRLRIDDAKAEQVLQQMARVDYLEFVAP
jgi:hypothetical protein